MQNRKRKTAIIIASIVFSSISSFGQYANKQNTYLDALKLADINNSIKAKPKNTKDTIYNSAAFVEAFKKIVHKYGEDPELLSNPFLKDVLFGIYGPDTVQVSEMIINGGTSKKAIIKDIRYKSEAIPAAVASGSMGFQAAIINGVSNFMAGRFKQEVIHMGIDKLFSQIVDPKTDSAIISAIFPKTYLQIKNMHSSGTYYTPDLLYLRQVAQNDIEQLPISIVNNTDIIFPILKNKPKAKDMLLLGSGIVKFSQQGQPLPELLSLIAQQKYSSKDSSIWKLLNLADLLSQALIDTANSKNIWVNPLLSLPTSGKDFKKIEIRYFYGLLYEQLRQIPEIQLYFKQNNVYIEDVNILADKIQKTAFFVNNLNNTYNYLKYKNFNFKNSGELVIYTKEINQSIYSFASTIMEIKPLNEKFKLDDSVLQMSTKYLNITEAFINKEYQRAIPLLTIEFGNYMATSGSYTRSMIFISQLGTIEDAEDMEVLLQAYALPIGSSSIKRHSKFNLSVNGYVGLTGGIETAYGSLENQTKGNVGLAAPIGISSTFNNGKLTGFISFIDLGTMVNQRLNNDTAYYNNLQFEHFFSPGLGFFGNIYKMPITIGCNFNYIPNLRTIKYNNNGATITNTNTSVTRLNVSVLIDIPFFTLYNKGIEKRRN